MSDRKLSMTGMCSEKVKNRYYEESRKRKIPARRLISYAIEKELEREDAFEYVTELPESGMYDELTFADEGGKIFNWMMINRPTSLDIMCLLREDIGIPNKDTLLAAIREMLDADVIETIPPIPTKYIKEFPEGFLHYALKGEAQETAKKKRNKVNEYEKYLKLKKKYGEEA